jgi:CheY-like chemotaxis protein
VDKRDGWAVREVSGERTREALRREWQQTKYDLHVLLVDDDRDLRDLYSLALHAFGPYRVTTASNGADVLAKARALLPDAIVTDFSMPGLNGGQLVERLAAEERTRRIPIIMISGVFEDVPDHVRRSCAAFHAKPCDAEELWRLVTLVMAARRSKGGACPVSLTSARMASETSLTCPRILR